MATTATVIRGRLQILLSLLLLLLVAAEGRARRTSMHRHLKRINKPPIRSIQSPDGDIIDCVHISRQPAFDHPFLRNHTIQMRPAFHPEGDGFFQSLHAQETETEKKTQKQKPVLQQWHLRGRCPVGTVPIRRTKEQDVLRATSIRSYGRKQQHMIRFRGTMLAQALAAGSSSSGTHQHAIAYIQGGKYYGARATMNVWQPHIEQASEFSLSQLWVLAGSFAEDLNSIEAGWQVSPELYGDNSTRLFTYWTSDAYQATGCYNLLCSGFIQINNDIAMGASIYPISDYGASQFDITILVWKDPKEGNWWLQFGRDHLLGYWPPFLFSHLAESASMIEWGGEVVNSEPDGSHTSTQMGSGHFPEEGFGKSSYFKNIQVVDESNNLGAPDGVGTFTEQSNCYDVQTGSNANTDWGTYLYFGGPGRNPDCP